MAGDSLHPNGAVSSIIALGVARQAAENSLSSGATTSNVPEGTNLYFTTARARNVISALSPIAYNNSTGQISASIATSDVSGLQTALNGKEPAFSKNTAFNKNFGTTSGTVCQGDDSRLSDARTPLAHAHIINDITGLQTSLDGKALSSHTHSISNITGLQTELDGKQSSFTGYNGTINVVTSVNFGTNTVTNAVLTITNGVITNVSI